jgi:predicted dehydrogenase
MDKNTYKAAIIGIGQIGYTIDHDPTRDYIWSHAKTYALHPATNLLAVSEINDDLCDSFSQHYNEIEIYTNYIDMINELGIQLISVCTPTSSHLSIVSEIVNQKSIKAIFIEKPVGGSKEESKEISQLCADNQVVLASNYMRRWDNKYKYINHLLKKKIYGNLQTIVAYGATSLLTSACHLLDLIIFFGGEVEWVDSDLQQDYVRIVNGFEDPGAISMIKFRNRAHSFLKATSKNDENFMFEIDIMCDDGRLNIKESWDDNDQADLDIYEFLPRNSDKTGRYMTLKQKQYRDSLVYNERMIDAVSDIINCIESVVQVEPASSGLNAIAVHEIIDGIKSSSINKKRFQL